MSYPEEDIPQGGVTRTKLRRGLRSRLDLRPVCGALSGTRLLTLLCLAYLGTLAAVVAQPRDVYPVRSGPSALSLNGSWSFKYLEGLELGADANFIDTAPAGAEAWPKITVPGHWELQGFVTPKYGKDQLEGPGRTGLYRRNFRVPAAWQGQRVFLHFDGVLYGFDAWVNGTKVGSWTSAYNPAAFDITDVVNRQGDNMLAVRVTTRSHGWEFDLNDCWALAGIHRDVTLFAVPPAHFQSYTAQTRLAPDGTATLSVATRLSAEAVVQGRLLAPDGQAVGPLAFPANAATSATTELKISTPQLWTAETPSLYTLELSLSSGQKLSEKIGLREVSIVDGVLLLNGSPIKLRGVDHHDLWPEHGRVATMDLMRRDLKLMQAANINFIRTAHYPPDPRFLGLCDELGFYVMDEVSIGGGDIHLANPDYAESMLTRARSTIERDHNHPSVIVWSVGNENRNTPLTIATARRVKELDPTRPVCFPQTGDYFAGSYTDLPDDLDIYAPHYPKTPTVRDYAEKLTRPIIFTEYAHALGLAPDQIQAQWAIMQSSPRIAGGAVWLFQDQAILRTAGAGQTPESSRDLRNSVWPDAKHYYDTAGVRGMDGIVYADRTPQVDYWQVRKVYSPVQITAQLAPVCPSVNHATLLVENRFDFRSLQGITMAWSLLRNGTAVENGSVFLKAAARTTETVPLSFTLPADAGDNVFTLDLHCAEGASNRFYERSFRLDTLPAHTTRIGQLAALRPSASLGFGESAAEIRITHPDFTLTVTRATGEITLRDTADRVLAAGFYPHAGRRFSEAECMRARGDKTWTGSFLRPATAPEVTAARSAEGIVVSVRGRYPRPDSPEQSLDGGLRLLVRTNGTIEADYDYVPVKGGGMLLQAGLSLIVPASASEFRWIGAGPYAGYPGTDVLNEFGRFHLNRADLHFQGNRRQVEVALLTGLDGAGVALGGTDMDVAVERDGENTILSHNALISGRGTKFEKPDTIIKADDKLMIKGHFTLLPLATVWPSPLTEWFGPASAKARVFQPYFHSYDQ